MGFTNHLVLRKHTDFYHPDKNLKTVQIDNSAVQGTHTSPQIITMPNRKKGICAFFLQPRGCKKGSDCDFLHEQNNKTMVTKVRKACRNGLTCFWKPGCKFLHPEDGDVMPPRVQGERELGFTLPDLTKPPPGYNLASSMDFPNIQRVSVIRQNMQEIWV